MAIPDSPLPKGWGDRLLDGVDLEASFAELRECRHFHGYSQRGRIRSLQSRPDEACEWFDKADRLAESADPTIPNLVRTFLLQVFKFENVLLFEDAERGEIGVQPFLPQLPDEVLDEFPEVRMALNLRKRIQGLYHLHVGHPAEAREYFLELADDASARPDQHLATYICLACCANNLDDAQQRTHYLDAAELAIHSAKWLFNQAAFSARLEAIYGYLGDEPKTKEWRDYQTSLCCPQASKDAFRRRAAHCITLRRDENMLFVF